MPHVYAQPGSAKGAKPSLTGRGPRPRAASTSGSIEGGQEARLRSAAPWHSFNSYRIPPPAYRVGVAALGVPCAWVLGLTVRSGASGQKAFVPHPCPIVRGLQEGVATGRRTAQRPLTPQRPPVRVHARDRYAAASAAAPSVATKSDASWPAACAGCTHCPTHACASSTYPTATRPAARRRKDRRPPTHPAPPPPISEPDRRPSLPGRPGRLLRRLPAQEP